jgi:hypothetical protein
MPRARVVCRHGFRLLENGSHAAVGVGAKQDPIVMLPGVRRVGTSSALKDTFVGVVRARAVASVRSVRHLLNTCWRLLCAAAGAKWLRQ